VIAFVFMHISRLSIVRWGIMAGQGNFALWRSSPYWVSSSWFRV